MAAKSAVSFWTELLACLTLSSNQMNIRGVMLYRPTFLYESALERRRVHKAYCGCRELRKELLIRGEAFLGYLAWYRYREAHS
ncbi:MAG: hypothetical protein U5K84_04415 [Alkalibacterium sp.]|nr:hypothetical protein [Alkalibacterium sp.]